MPPILIAISGPGPWPAGPGHKGTGAVSGHGEGGATKQGFAHLYPHGQCGPPDGSVTATGVCAAAWPGES